MHNLMAYVRDSIAVARKSRSRTFVAGINLCALVSDGQHLFSLYESWAVIIIFPVTVDRVLTAFSKGVPFLFNRRRN